MKIDLQELKKELSKFPKMVKDPTSNEQDAITWHWNFLRKFEGFEKELREADKSLHDEKGFVSIYSVRELKRIREILGK